MAAPLVTSLVAGLLQAYPALMPFEVIQAIKLSASQSSHPDNQLGYGVPNYTAVKNYLEISHSVNEVLLFPNPTTTVLKLAFRSLPSGPVSISIYDLQGKQMNFPVITSDWLNNPLDVPISNLSVGTYLLKVETSTTVKTFRFVKL